MKLKDRIKFFRHRCVASLGNNMYEKAYDYLKDAISEGASAEEKRDGLVQILGEDWIGFWAILDQILFYEGMIDELSCLNESGGSEYSDDIMAQRRGVEDAIESRQGRRNLNEDSDLELEENDGQIVGDSGSEKGEII